MKKLNSFHLFVFLFLIIVASLLELSIDYEKYQAKQAHEKLNNELLLSED